MPQSWMYWVIKLTNKVFEYLNHKKSVIWLIFFIFFMFSVFSLFSMFSMFSRSTPWSINLLHVLPSKMAGWNNLQSPIPNSLACVTTATSGGGVLFSGQCPFLHRECEILANFLLLRIYALFGVLLTYLGICELWSKSTMLEPKDKRQSCNTASQINGISGGYNLPTLITSLPQVFLTLRRQNIYLQFQYLLSYKLTVLRFQFNTRRPIKGFCISKSIFGVLLIVNVYQISQCFPNEMISLTGGLIFQKTKLNFMYLLCESATILPRIGF